MSGLCKGDTEARSELGRFGSNSKTGIPPPPRVSPRACTTLTLHRHELSTAAAPTLMLGTTQTSAIGGLPTALLDIEPRLRRVRGYLPLPKLRANGFASREGSFELWEGT
jgi:hypothetical protein